MGVLSRRSQEWEPAVAVALMAALVVAAIGLAITPAHSRDLIGMFAIGDVPPTEYGANCYRRASLAHDAGPTKQRRR